MDKFTIKKIDPKDYKKEILYFWEKYLPWTPISRFEWLKFGNPAGETIWFMAFHKETEEIAGTISVIPRDIFINGQRLRAGMLGDFMIIEKYRVFGPMKQLPKAVIQNMLLFKFEALYTIPNKKSKNVIESCGFKTFEMMKTMVRPININYYLEKYTKYLPTSILSNIISFIFVLRSLLYYVNDNGIFDESTNIDERYVTFLDNYINNIPSDLITFDKSSNYIKWRYINDLNHYYKFMSYRNNDSGNIIGLIIYNINNNYLNIYDLISSDEISKYKLIKNIIKIAKCKGVKSINCKINENNKLIKILKRFNFFDGKDDLNVEIYGDNIYLQNNINILYGEKII